MPSEWTPNFNNVRSGASIAFFFFFYYYYFAIKISPEELATAGAALLVAGITCTSTGGGADVPVESLGTAFW